MNITFIIMFYAVCALLVGLGFVAGLHVGGYVKRKNADRHGVGQAK